VIRVVLGTLMLAACGAAHRGPPVSELALDTELERSGQRQFMKLCHECHPHGAGGLGPAINNKPLPAPTIRLQIRQGLGAMPAFGNDELDDTEVEAIIGYLKALRRATK
jgi:mono/diheme cytochrome c family protein